jgi:hypothetical protein
VINSALKYVSHGTLTTLIVQFVGPPRPTPWKLYVLSWPS